MSKLLPTISVIIPTHNRRMLLRLVLDALANQTFPVDQFEVVVVLDGCEDGCQEMLREYSAPFNLQIIEQELKGPSAARNQGARLANSELLIFLDDDIEPTPGFIQAHVDAHQGSPAKVVIGYSPPALAVQKNYFSLELQGWWEKMFQAMNQPGHRFKFTDMLSGNFSIPREVFLSIGGFSLEFKVHEDYELGARLILAGIPFAFKQDALAVHHERSDIKTSLFRKYQEGICDISLGRLYPELISGLPISLWLKNSSLPNKVLRFMQFKLIKLGDWITTAMLESLPLLSRVRILWMWRKILYGLLGYWYWKGVAQELTTTKEVNDFVTTNPGDASAQKIVKIELDLSQGLDKAEMILENTRPDSASLYFEEKFIGTIPGEVGAERLHGAHLRPFLVKRLSRLVGGISEDNMYLPPASIEEIVVLFDTNNNGTNVS